MKCRWCNRHSEFEVGILHYIIPKAGKAFYGCNGCIIKHGREDDYDKESPYADLLNRLEKENNNAAQRKIEFVQK